MAVPVSTSHSAAEFSLTAASTEPANAVPRATVRHDTSTTEPAIAATASNALNVCIDSVLTSPILPV